MIRKTLLVISVVLMGYDLTGNVSGVCPECGQATPANAEQ